MCSWSASCGAQGYRPVDIADIRLVSMTRAARQLEWTVGDSDPQALARYRAALDRSAPLRFPADQDRFELRPVRHGCVPTND